MQPPLESPLLERLARAERSAGVWRGVVFGFIAGALFVGLLLVAVVGRAQEIPREAHNYQRDLIREARAVWGLAAPSASFAAQIHQESRWRRDARSPVGAAGLAQFMPSTSAWISGVYRADLGDNAPLDPRWAMRALVIYMRWLHDRVAGLDRCERMAFAMSGYNGGLGWVNRRKAASEYPLICFAATCRINPGITEANQRENERYSERILLTLEPVYAGAGFGLGVCT